MDSFFHEKKNRLFLCEGEPDTEVMLFQLEMLKTQSKIHGDIINAWSNVLNFNEQYRDINSSGRFFLGLNAVDCLFQYESDRAQERNKMFCEVVELEFSKTIIPKKDIELFFFPVFEKDHYYLVCFNTTTDCGTIEVIDYSEGP
ncbi:uncharacterized protein LOC110711456 [Chenopodium quinoa]|uniref:uncharacterized protein LOC110711456 n=1 Tax=Chenopodium quinoa TaxID=63459 RepID=UPI000B77754D|nr:uncharacterized protein LOC110711456 [Chenopodium quinoa]